MTTQRENFEVWWIREGEPPYKVDLWVAWLESGRQMIERCATLCDEKAAYARLHGGAQNGALMAQMLADDIRAMGDD